jgi:hypothetical protein
MLTNSQAQAWVRVEDDGPGSDAAHLHQVFASELHGAAVL